MSPNTVFPRIVFAGKPSDMRNLKCFKHLFYKPIINTSFFLFHEKTPRLFSHPLTAILAVRD